MGERRDDDLHELQALLAEYEQMRGDEYPRLHEVRGAINALITKPRDTELPLVAELVERWWDSSEAWEAYTAVSAPVVTDRERLLRKAGEAPHVASAAIQRLRGEGSPYEIEVLRSVVTNPEGEWRWARAAAAARLRAIGGPEAEAALQDRPFTLLDPPWREDRTWLHRHRATAVPRLIECLADPVWWFEASFALGEIHAAEAVGPLCEHARTTPFPIPTIEALGKIGSADASPTLVGLLGHHDADVRDHALRALARIGGQDVVEAAIMACDDVSPVVRDRAARVLFRHGDQRAVIPLIRLCDTRHAAAAADALTRIGDPRALPTLWGLFTDLEAGKATRYAAGRGLARIDGPQRWLYSDDPRLLRAYVWLLGHKPHWNEYFVIESARSHADPVVRARAAEAWGRRRGTGKVSGREKV